jgi:integrase
VPLHSTTTHALQRYAERRDRHAASTLSEAFFVFDDGRPATPSRLHYAFRQLRRALGWRARGGHPAPRLHDLRHTLVCRRLERWYAAGHDVDHEIVALATYLGHTHVTATYWYLTATPALLAHAARRGERSSATDRHPTGGDA